MKANLLAAAAEMPVFGVDNSTRGPQSIHHRETELAMSAETDSEFERTFLPHLDAAYNLARVLIRNAPDAEDLVQEAYLRALRGFKGFRGTAARPWLLKIVRNTCYTWMRDNRVRADVAEFDEQLHAVTGGTPETQSLSRERASAVGDCIERLPLDFREVIILREMEQLSYEEIAGITGVPTGTVMSRLSRARSRLSKCLKLRLGLEDRNDLR
jgi:RNA polymerase sigma factor (sigma-70 family)